jgi:hypothetical protein
MADISGGGIAQLFIDGTPYELEGSFSLTLGGVVGKYKAGLSAGTVRRMDENVIGEAECTIPDTKGLSLTQLQAIKGASILFVMSIGRRMLLPNAGTDGAISVDEKGAIKMKFSGQAMQES